MIPIHDNNPTHRKPIVTVSLIVICVLVFFWQVSLGPRGATAVVYSFGFIPALLFTDASLPPELAVVPAGATLFTSMFLHGSFMHLLGNMLYLWVFGNNVEDRMGRIPFILFYLAAGIVAVYSQVLTDPDSTVPLIGASGAIAGTLGAYLVMFPHARVLTLVPIFFFLQVAELSAVLVLGFWFVLQALQGVGSLGGQVGGVAWWAHIGGFVFGALIALLFYRRRREREFPSPADY